MAALVRSVQLLLAACEDILDTINTFSSIIKCLSNDDTPPDIPSEEHFQKMVIATSTIIRYAEEWLFDDPEAVLVALASMISINIRTSVLQFVPITRACILNARDFLTFTEQQSAQNEIHKFTGGLKFIAGIYLREKQRNEGKNFGLVDALDAESLLLVQLGADLITESRELIHIAVQGDPLGSLDAMAPYSLALQRFMDSIRRYPAETYEPFAGNLERHKKSILALSQDIEQYSSVEIAERGSTISIQIVEDSVALLLQTLLYQQTKCDEIGTKVVSAPSTPPIATRDRPRMPQKPNRTTSGRDMSAMINKKSDTSVRAKSTVFDRSPLVEIPPKVTAEKKSNFLRGSMDPIPPLPGDEKGSTNSINSLVDSTSGLGITERSKKKRRKPSASARLPDSSSSFTIQSIQAPEEVEKKLTELFECEQTPLGIHADVMVRKKKSKKKFSQRKSLPLRSSKNTINQETGVPLFVS